MRIKREHGRILSVETQTRGSALAADVAAGATTITVDDAGDFDEDGGWLYIGSQVVEFTAVDDDAGTITLATALAAAGEDGDPVHVWSPLYEETVDYQVAQVELDGEFDNLDPVEAEVAEGVDDLWEGDRGGPGEACTLHRIAADEWEVVAVGGRPRKASGAAGTKFFQDSAFAPGPGDLDVPLTYLPVENSEHVYWNGIYQPGSEWTRDGQIIVVPDPDGYFVVGDEVTVEYAYRDGVIVTPTVPEPVPTVDPAASNVWLLDATLSSYQGTGINTSKCGGTTFLGQVGSVSYPDNPTFAGQNTAGVAQEPSLPPWVEGIKVYIVYDGDEDPETHHWSEAEQTCTGTVEGFGPPTLKINTGTGQTIYRPGDPDTGTTGYVRTAVAGTGMAAYLCEPYAGSYLLNRIRTTGAVTVTAGGRGAVYGAPPPSSIHREWTVNSLGIILVYPEA